MTDLLLLGCGCLLLLVQCDRVLWLLSGRVRLLHGHFADDPSLTIAGRVAY